MSTTECSILRLAYEAFELYLKAQLIIAKRNDLDDYEDTFSFYVEVQQIVFLYSDILIEYDTIWSNIGLLLNDKISWAKKLDNFPYAVKYSDFLTKYFSVEDDFVFRDSFLDDTVSAISPS